MGTVVGLVADSPSAGRVMEAGLLAARAYGLRQQYIHVTSSSNSNANDNTGDNMGISERLRSLAQSVVGDAGLIETMSLDRVDETTLGLSGDDAPSLLVLGAVPREGVVRDLVGSTARRLALRSRSSVLLVSTAGPSPARWRRFVVSVRYTPAGERVAQAVSALARASSIDESDRASLTFAWEVRRPSTGDGVPRPFDMGLGERTGLSGERFKLAAFTDGVLTQGLDVSGVCLDGRPGQEVSRYAEDARVDVLGVAAPDEPMGFLSRLLSHPVRLVLDRLPCSVLICRRGGPGGGVDGVRA